MIRVYVNDQSFIYDVQSLFMAFYPGNRITVSDDEEKLAPAVNEPEDSEAEEAEDWYVIISDDNIKITPSFKPKASDLHQATDTDRDDISIAISDLPRKEVKNQLKLALYRILSDRCAHTLPWGTLTGIRPTKIAYGMLENGAEVSEIAEYMRNVYRTGEDKISLATRIASREYEILNSIEKPDGYSLYIGIPFCPSICLYCSFASSPIAVWANKVDAYLDALIKEIQEMGRLLSDRPLQTVYIGGGTPTSLTAPQLERLLDALDGYFDLSKIYEYTVEAGRPDSIDFDKLNVLAGHNVDRISINPQTMNQKTLDLIGRHHTVDDIYRAYEMVRYLGFKTVNMDIITGLPGEGIEEVRHTADEIRRLGPDDLTVHSLAIKRSSRLKIEWDRYCDELMFNSDEIMNIMDNVAYNLRMSPYYMYRQKNIAGNLENIGYAIDGHEGLYNILIMEERQDIIALGAGADSKKIARDGTEYDHQKKVQRCENVKDIDSYINRIDEMIERKRALFF